MQHEFTAVATSAVERYTDFLTLLRGQADVAFRRGAALGSPREEAVNVAQDAARRFLGLEQAQLNEDTADIARAAHSAAQRDLAVSETTIDDRFGDFIFSAAAYTGRMLASQIERDVMTMAQHIHTTEMRIDLYVRSGRHTPSSAAAAVMLEDNQAPGFRFVDRVGRRYKSTKHIRDIWRQHLLHIYNEVYMAVVADHGWEIVKIDHLDPHYKWYGEPVAIVSHDDRFPLYYDIKDEVFHPSSDALITIAL